MHSFTSVNPNKSGFHSLEQDFGGLYAVVILFWGGMNTAIKRVWEGCILVILAKNPMQ